MQLIVVHAMAERVIVDGREIPAEDWLTVDFPDIDEVWSADATIDPGGRVRLLNPEPATHYSWHAGRSAWASFPRHRNGLNHVSVGVELLVEGAHTITQLIRLIRNPGAFRPVQYRSAGWLCADWEATLGGGELAILGHQQIATADVRPDPKHDPGNAFEWSRLFERMAEYKAAYYS